MEKLNAPGGKSNASRGSKWSAPVTITTITVRIVPIHSVSVIVAIDLIRRYSSAMFTSPVTVITRIVCVAVMPFQM